MEKAGENQNPKKQGKKPLPKAKNQQRKANNKEERFANEGNGKKSQKGKDEKKLNTTDNSTNNDINSSINISGNIIKKQQKNKKPNDKNVDDTNEVKVHNQGPKKVSTVSATKTQSRNNSNRNNKKDDLNTKEEKISKGQTKPRNKKSSNSNRKRNTRLRNRENEGFRIIMRLLPPNLTEKEFLDTICQGLQNDNFFQSFGIVDFYFVQGLYSTKAFSEPIYSRAYLIFEQMDKLREFGMKVQNISFVDDKDNTTKATLKMSTYVKRFTPDSSMTNSEDSKVSKNKKKQSSSSSLEGTLEKDRIYKVFLQSLKTIEENEGTDYIFNGNISLLKPLEKELARQKEVETSINRKKEQALVELAGSFKKEKKSKKSEKAKKKKKKAKKKKVAKLDSDATSTAEKKAKKKLTVNNNSNVVILEAAGKKELLKRKKIKMKKDLEKSKLKSSLPTAGKGVSDKITKSKYNMNSEPFISSHSNSSATQPVKILQRDSS